jgi:hypothetical protein
VKDMANDMANEAHDLGNESTPLFDRVINELGNPVMAPPIDRSYEAIVEIAEASRVAAPVKEPSSKGPKEKGALPAPAQSSDSPASIAG